MLLVLLLPLLRSGAVVTIRLRIVSNVREVESLLEAFFSCLVASLGLLCLLTARELVRVLSGRREEGRVQEDVGTKQSRQRDFTA